ncbi:metallophosphoesterase [Colwellia psychrerythraea]|uniref:Metallophosphoesterase n=1 Tax=Colwellia psychrerythraea TaxID=28229 RepID=A0A099KHG0_COLPS|nr:metallophosphoesterase [Colwellia psychrerythraea]KGJ89043.1 metallophosphoesterase [Colwellia psychrerythraea]
MSSRILNTVRSIAFTAILLLASSVSTFAFSSADEKAKVDPLKPPLKPELKQVLKQKLKPVFAPVNDGPYVFVNQKQELESYWLCQGEVVNKTLAITEESNFPVDISACNMPASVHAFSSIENKLLEFSGDYPVAALSDFHGKYDLMIELLTNNNIIDDNKNWAFGKGHFVITGDIFDRGDKVTEILWFLYDLEQQAQKAGGNIHLTLGNHEVMILNGDLRYLHAKYIETAKQLNKPFEKLFTKNSIIGNWLRSKPVLVKVNNMLFAHGGFHPSLAIEQRSLVEVNTTFKDSLVKAELEKPREGFAKFLHKTNGVIWYRGYFADDYPEGSKKRDNGATSAEIDLLLKNFKVKHLIVGHTSQKQIETRYQGRVIAIDSSIKRGSYGEILFVENGKKWRGSMSGKVLPLYHQ